MAGLSRGRAALPPRHDEGDAFAAGGGTKAGIIARLRATLAAFVHLRILLLLLTSDTRIVPTTARA